MTFSRFSAMQWLLPVAAIGVLLYLLSPILTPFVAAGILAYICNPLVQRLCALNVPRIWSVVLVMLCALLLIFGLMLIMLPLLEKEISLFMVRLPEMIDVARARFLPQLQQLFGTSLDWDAAALKKLLVEHWQSAGGVAQKIIPWLASSGGAIVAVLVNMLLIPVVMFYFLRDWNVMLARIDALVPRQWHAQVSHIAQEVDSILAEFLRGQIAVMALMSAFYSLVLWLVGLEFALPIGILAGMLVFVPYLGMVLGMVFATLSAAMQFSEFSNVVWVWAVFGAGQLLEGMIVTPMLVGERVGLHPLAVIFALMAFGQLFGFFGILLALPLAAILLVCLRHGKAWYLSSQFYQKL